jgi:hypothetical protein
MRPSVFARFRKNSALRLCGSALLLAALGAMGQPIFWPLKVSQYPQPQVTEATGRPLELVSRLSLDAPAERQPAARLLMEMGPSIEPQLRWALQREEPAPNFPGALIPGTFSFRMDPKLLLPRYARNELDVLVSHLEESRQLKGSTVTLHYKDAPLTNVLQDLGAQADTDVWAGSWYLDPSAWVNTNRVTVDVDRVTYWEALQAVEQSAGLRDAIYNGQNLLTFVRAGPVEPAARERGTLPKPVVCGPFQIRAISAESNRLSMDQHSSKSARVKLNLEVRGEARLRNTGTHALVRIEQCVDDRGDSLIAGGHRTFAAAENSFRAHWTVPVELAEPQPRRRIKTLKGRLSVAAGVEQRYLAITNLMGAQGQSREFDELRIEIKAVAVADQRYRIDVDLSAPTASPYTLTFAERELPNLQLWDESRESITRPDDVVFVRNGIRAEGGREVASWQLSCSRLPATLTWLTPEETRWLTVPFELQDIPVPFSLGE